MRRLNFCKSFFCKFSDSRESFCWDYASQRTWAFSARESGLVGKLPLTVHEEGEVP